MLAKHLRNALVVAALGVSVTALPAQAHEDHSKHSQAKPTAAQSARVTLPDTAVIDQNGRKLGFRSDVLGNRIVIVDFVFTSCTTVCPVVSAVLAQTQAKLGARLGRDVSLVTVTVDPVRDTPARLKEYGSRIGAGPGWTWVTGAKPQVDEVLKAFGAYTPNFNDHPPLVFVGDPSSGKWLRFYGFPSPDQVMSAVGELTAAREKTAAAGS
jgi:protein SCO1